jgi:hypothetical protein
MLHIAWSYLWRIYKEQPEFAIHKDKIKKRYFEIVKEIPTKNKSETMLSNLLFAAFVIAAYEMIQPEDFLQFKKTIQTGIQPVFAKLIRKADIFSYEYQFNLKQKAEKSAKATHPFAWVFTVEQGDCLDDFQITYTKCGICTLCKQYNVPHLVPIFCELDFLACKDANYTLERSQTLATAPSCDFTYHNSLNTISENEQR